MGAAPAPAPPLLHVRPRRTMIRIMARGHRSSLLQYRFAAPCWARFALLLVSVTFTAASPATAQSRYGWGWGRRYPPKFPDPSVTPDRSFTFGRIMYRSVRGERGGYGWNTDYPGADVNFMWRFNELTAAGVSIDENGNPNHVVVTLTDDRLFDYPFLFMSDVGTIGLTGIEAERLKQYLLRGGFLWVDDFWGELAWRQWANEIGKALPPEEYPIFDLTPEHPIYRILYDVEELPQIPSINHWRRTGGHGTSERGLESSEPHLRGIADRNGRLMVVMSHNTDIADGWEREGEEYEYFFLFSSDAYAVGVNIVLYAMTH